MVPTFCRHNALIQTCPTCRASRPSSLVRSSARARRGRPSPARPADVPAGRAGRLGAKVVLRRRSRGAASRPWGGRRLSGLARHRLEVKRGRRTARGGAGLCRIPLSGASSTTRRGSTRRWRAPAGDVEERTWRSFLIVYPRLLEGEVPFSEIERVRTTWASGEMPDLDDVQTGPRTAHDPARGTRTLEAYRVWARRVGSQAAAFTGDDAWMPSAYSPAPTSVFHCPVCTAMRASICW